MKNKRDLLRAHRWIALFLAPLIFLQALTGSLILFRAELMRATLPQPASRHSATTALPISAMFSAAAQAQPHHHVVRIFLPATNSDAAFVQLADTAGSTRYVALDPATARVLASGSIWRFPAEAALQIHYRLLNGKWGMAIVLLNALVLMVMSATGVLYWWPGRRRLAKALTISRQAPPRAQLRQWHRSIGVILTPMLLFSAATGLLLIVPDLLAQPPAPARQTAPAAPELIDRAFARAVEAFPQARPRDIRLAANERMDVNFHAPRYNSQAVDAVSIRLSDGRPLKRVLAEDNPAPWITWLPLHSGSVIGWPGRILLLFEGLVLMILATTGPLMWWQARRPQQRKT